MNLKTLKNNKLAIWLIGFPMLLAILYYSFFALDRYVSTAQVVVRQVGGNEAPQVPGLAVMLNGLNPTSREETLYLREFVTSQDMLNVLQEKLNWKSHYEGRWKDPLYWLLPGAPQEDVLDFYRRVVTAHFDEQTGLLSINVQAFSPQFSEQVLKTILAESERFVNEISHRMAREQMAFSQGELVKARLLMKSGGKICCSFKARTTCWMPRRQQSRVRA
ncbi:Wzz/FepE/Etk N-terminal domain-containing protein [Bordetella trematum]|uniref:Wzz/FepE/Etk N-terminal domain-containing protein n=1 Tax=Bordetella trematum TaxID=123899 RepID=UPI003AF3B9F0